MESQDAVLLERIRSLGVIWRGELKEELREQYSDEIQKAVEHRRFKKRKTPLLNGHRRRNLRRNWVGINCPICGVETVLRPKGGHIVEVEHIIERALGGPDCDSNLVPCCRNCNRGLGQVFHEEVLGSLRRWGSMPKTMWVRLIGDWIVFKQLLYCDPDLAFWLFDSFHREFIRQCHKKEISEIECPTELDSSIFGLGVRTEMSERLQTASQALDVRINARLHSLQEIEVES
jgi:hypothetical protein